IHQSLVSVYTELGYEVVEVPWGTVPERVGFVRSVIGLLGEVAD
ncbi:ATPase, partial [Vibrio alginolyticus]